MNEPYIRFRRARGLITGYNLKVPSSPLNEMYGSGDSDDGMEKFSPVNKISEYKLRG